MDAVVDWEQRGVVQQRAKHAASSAGTSGKPETAGHLLKFIQDVILKMGQKRQGIEKNINGRGCPKATTTGGRR